MPSDEDYNRDERDERNEDERPQRNGDGEDRPRKRRYEDDEPAPKKRSPVLWILLGIGGLGFLLCGGCCIFFATRDKPAEDNSPPIVITAVQLDKEYEDNASAADKKYKGKRLEVTGKVKKVTEDDKPGKMRLELRGAEDDDLDSTVDFRFSKWDKEKQDQLAELKVGQTVTVRGRCIGHTKDLYVTLEDCEIVKEAEKKAEPKPDDTKPKPKPDDTKPPKPDDTKPKPSNTISADALASAYDKDQDDADKKYKGKVVEVSGTIHKLDVPKTGKATVELDTDDTKVQCVFLTKDAKPALDKFAEADKIVIRGTCKGLNGGVVLLENCTVVTKK